ncbi:MAG: NAD-binding protein [Acidimicrobiia bacterium]
MEVDAAVRTVARVTRDYHWHLITALAVVALVLGYVGFREYSDAQGAGWTVGDVLYRDVQLLALESGSVEGDVPWALDVARFLAPVAAGFAVVSALLFIFRDQLEAVRIARLRGHVVVCGAGRKGSLAIRSLRDSGFRVVAVEQNASCAHIEAALERGAHVVRGDARDPALLRKAGVPRATHLVVVCGSDAASAEVAVQARELLTTTSGATLSCIADIADPQLCALLRREEIALRREIPFRLDFFNAQEAGARILLREHPPDSRGNSSGEVHMVVVGLGDFGTRLVAQAALSMHGTERPIASKLRVTVVDREAGRRVARLRGLHPRIEDVCDVVALDMDIGSAEFRSGDFLTNAGGPVTATSVYVCLGSDADGLSTAFSLAPQLRDSAVPIVVRTSESTGLARLASDVEKRSGRCELAVFPLLDRTCNVEALLGGTREQIARAIHDDYLENLTDDASTRSSDPAAVAWDELPSALQESNRDQADHLGVKIRAVGCDLVPLFDGDAVSFRFTDAEIERLAEMEHTRWVDERRRHGWTHDARPKDASRRTTPHLVPWDDLEDDIRERDRSAVRAIPEFLARAGYQIVRL